MEKVFFESVKNELFTNILPYWEKYARDTRSQFQGFFGRIDNENVCDSECGRSIVMTSRFLWTYSSVARHTKNLKFLEMADFAYETIITKFLDKTNGGVYWSVLPDGTPEISKKQIYGEAFCIYGLSEYAAAVRELCEKTEENIKKSEDAMNLALELYNLLEKNALDSVKGGYLEACAQNWSQTTNLQLSPKDMNCPKSMNTNLHVMEAYTNLYRTLPVVFQNSEKIFTKISNSLKKLVRDTVQKILQKNNHLGMFFDMDWNLLSDEISYGHDIEASWLLWEAATELEDESLQNEIRETVIQMAQTALQEGFDTTNGCLENFSKENGKIRDRRRVWWVQAEAINGFFNAWQMTGEEKYEKACIQLWNWIQNFQKDKKGGEWFAEIDQNGMPLKTESKGGNWKTSYHNGRTCIELLQRTKQF